MSGKFDHGPHQIFRIIYANGKSEEIKAHQALAPHTYSDLILFHGEFNDKWQLVLALEPRQVKEIRNLSTGEVV